MRIFEITRIYEDPSGSEGYRILIDRLWPRGIPREKIKLDEWNRVMAPSPELRKWFSHRKDRFHEFSRRYRKELKDKQTELERIRQIAETHKVTLLYGARHPYFNHARVLRDVLSE